MKKIIFFVSLFLTCSFPAFASLDDVVIRSLFWIILSIGYIAVIFAITMLSIGIEYGKQENKKRKNQREKYRKYLVNCDKQGKTPLSYKQWKFAYTEKKKKTKQKTTPVMKKKTTKTDYYDDYWE